MSAAHVHHPDKWTEYQNRRPDQNEPLGASEGIDWRVGSTAHPAVPRDIRYVGAFLFRRRVVKDGQTLGDGAPG